MKKKDLAKYYLNQKNWAASEYVLTDLLFGKKSKSNILSYIRSQQSLKVLYEKKLIIRPCLYYKYDISCSILNDNDYNKIRSVALQESIAKNIDILSQIENELDENNKKILWWSQSIQVTDSRNNLVHLLFIATLIEKILLYIGGDVEIIAYCNLSDNELNVLNSISSKNGAKLIYIPNNNYRKLPNLVAPKITIKEKIKEGSSNEFLSMSAENILSLISDGRKAHFDRLNLKDVKELYLIECNKRDNGKPDSEFYINWRLKGRNRYLPKDQNYVSFYFGRFFKEPSILRNALTNNLESNLVCLNFLLTDDQLKSIRLAKDKCKDAFCNNVKLIKLKANSTDILFDLYLNKLIEEVTDAFIYDLLTSEYGFVNLITMFKDADIVHSLSPSKVAKLLTLIARKRGHKVRYVCDRVSGKYRPSNTPIGIESFSPLYYQNPDVIDIYDEITYKTFLGYGFPIEKINYYSNKEGESRQFKGFIKNNLVDLNVCLFTQDYKDNMIELLDSTIKVIKEIGCSLFVKDHPNFKIDRQFINEISSEYKLKQGQIVLLKDNEFNPEDYDIFISGYSSASLIPLSMGKKIIWLPDIVENSIFCKELIDDCGEIVADSLELKRLITRSF